MLDKMRIVSFASGSSGNCSLLSCGEDHILIDAGISMKRIREALELNGLRFADLTGIVISHEHSDHISGLPMIVKHHRIPVYAPRLVAEHLRRAIAGLEDCLHIIPVGESFMLGGVRVRAFHTPHDTDESVGYRFEKDFVFAFATDMGHVTEEIEQGLTGADAVMIEANHDPDMLLRGPYPPYLKRRILSPRGHLSNGDCACLAKRLAQSGTRYIVLAHLSRENNDPKTAFNTVQAEIADSAALYTAPAAACFTLELERKEACSL